MTSLIEAAAKRLEQLRSAGAQLPPDAGNVAGPVVSLPVEPAAKPIEDTGERLEIDLERLTRLGYATPSTARTLTHDQFRVIKRQLIRNASVAGAAKNGNLIMITSAMAGEGKTFSSINLAMSIAAELDHTVMLVDADVANPSILRNVSIDHALADPPPRGLMDLLEGSCELGDVLMRTNVEKLTVLPSGSNRPHATELLASEAMRQLLEQIATRYPDRIVIFDSPPLLLTTEAQVLASQMGQIMLVVQAGKTVQSAVRHALSTIETSPLKMVVLNQASVASGEPYGYGYGAPYARDASTPSRFEASKLELAGAKEAAA